MRVVVFGSLCLATSAFAAPKKAPARCQVAVQLRQPGDGTIAGTITKVTTKDTTVTLQVDDGKHATDVAMYSDIPLPLAKGDAIKLSYWCGGFGNHCDARIDDARGEPIVIAAMFGNDKLSAGWTSKVGAIRQAEQDVNQPKKSIRRVHALELTHGKTAVTVTGATCTTITDGGTTWLAQGSAVSWDGIRPPEGIDYRSYSLVRYVP